MKTADLQQYVTDSIIAGLEAGAPAWVKPWSQGKGAGSSFIPHNAATGRAYSGINVIVLWGHPYPTSSWLTFKQAQSLGGTVRKGEKATHIFYYGQATAREDDGTEKTIPVMKSYCVFNVAQCDGLVLPDATAPEPIDPAQAIVDADAMMAQARVHHVNGDRAYYQPAQDHIVLPMRSQFNSTVAYYQTALHELVHWTGHQSRIAREYGKRFGDEAYAREELVAEIGAAFLCAHVGIDGMLQHVGYIESWIKVLQSDRRAIFTASSAAWKSYQFITQARLDDQSEPIAA